MRSLLLSIVALASMDSFGQISASFDSIGGKAWNDITVEEVKSLFPEVPREWNAPPSRAYLMGGPCISIPGPLLVQFDNTGVRFVFDRIDTTRNMRLLSLMVTRAGAVVTPNHVDVGEKLSARSNSDGSPLHTRRLNDLDYLEIIDHGVFYYCKPASVKRARKGKPVKVAFFKVRGD